jgi:hypothetical protein
MTYKPTASQTGEAVTISITTEQLKLLARACNHYVSDYCGVKSDEELEEMAGLAYLCNDVIKDAANDPPDMLYGFAL